MGDPAVLEPAAPAAEAWRIDVLAHAAGVSVDTIRYYQREGLLPRPQRKGRHKLYGADHLLRLERIKELQERRFSLAAIRALLEVAGNIEGIFGGGTGATYSLGELTGRSGLDPALVQRLRDAGLLSDPSSCGREAYDGADLDVLHAVLELVRAGIPEDVIVEIDQHLRRRRRGNRTPGARGLRGTPRPALGPRGAGPVSGPQRRGVSRSPALVRAWSPTCTSARSSASRST